MASESQEQIHPKTDLPFSNMWASVINARPTFDMPLRLSFTSHPPLVLRE
jgi:hypothetical protein